MIKDLSIYESKDGGEILSIGGDINLADTLLQLVYIALFGGNIESDTIGNEKQGAVRNDWWGNALLFPNAPEKQLNSLTERTLNSVALNSAGRVRILNSVNEDLKFLQPIADVQADVIIAAANRVEITVKLNRYQDRQEMKLQFLWDSIQNSIIIHKII